MKRCAITGLAVRDREVGCSNHLAPTIYLQGFRDIKLMSLFLFTPAFTPKTNEETENGCNRAAVFLCSKLFGLIYLF
jgi:hypothetical protein